MKVRVSAVTAIVIQSDDQIIKRVQAGEGPAFVELFDRYYAQIHRFARWQTGDAEAASDFAIETFERAYRAIKSFRTGENTPYLAYLLQITRRLIIAERVRVRRGTIYSLDDPEASAKRLIDSCSLPMDIVLEEERRATVRDALDRLSPEDREIILLAFERDLTRRDIAAVTGKPSTTAVSSHLHRAMKKLRVIVAQQGYFGAPNNLGGV